LGAYAGVGSYANGDVNDQLRSAGYDEIKSGFEFGGSFRYPVSSKLSLDVEVDRLRGRSDNAFSGGGREKITTSGTPLVGNLYIGALESEDTDVDVFLGAGPLFSAKIEDEVTSLGSASFSKT